MVVPTNVHTSPQKEDSPSDTDQQQGGEDSLIKKTQEYGEPLSDPSTYMVSIPSASSGPSRKTASVAILGKETVIIAMKLSTVVGETIKTAAEIQ